MNSEKISREIQVEGIDLGDLLINFLNELISLSDLHKEIYDEFEFQRPNPLELKAKLSGFRFQNIKAQVKGATHHELKCEKNEQGYEAEIVFDV